MAVLSNGKLVNKRFDSGEKLTKYFNFEWLPAAMWQPSNQNSGANVEFNLYDGVDKNYSRHRRANKGYKQYNFFYLLRWCGPTFTANHFLMEKSTVLHPLKGPLRDALPRENPSYKLWSFWFSLNITFQCINELVTRTSSCDFCRSLFQDLTFRKLLFCFRYSIQCSHMANLVLRSSDWRHNLLKLQLKYFQPNYFL